MAFNRKLFEALHGKPKPRLKTWTVFVQEADGTGTIHIQSYRAHSIEEARAKALARVAEDWGGAECGFTPDTLHILGIAEGNVKIVEWTDIL